jgi:hypothetical protein
MALREAHRHVEVIGATGERAVEDWHHEPRVDGVHHVGDAMLTNHLGDVVGPRRVDARGGEALVADRIRRLLGA